MNTLRSKQHGFTLVKILLSLAIISGLSLSIFRVAKADEADSIHFNEGEIAADLTRRNLQNGQFSMSDKGGKSHSCAYWVRISSGGKTTFITNATPVSFTPPDGMNSHSQGHTDWVWHSLSGGGVIASRISWTIDGDMIDNLLICHVEFREL